jgi:hypothetical protein
MQDVLEAGSASEGHYDGPIIPRNKHLIAHAIGKRLSTEMYPIPVLSADWILYSKPNNQQLAFVQGSACSG